MTVRRPDTGVGLHYVDLEIEAVKPGGALQFTFYWPESDRWEGKNYEVELGAAVANATQAHSPADKRRPVVALTA